MLKFKKCRIYNLALNKLTYRKNVQDLSKLLLNSETQNLMNSFLFTFLIAPYENHKGCYYEHEGP